MVNIMHTARTLSGGKKEWKCRVGLVGRKDIYRDASMDALRLSKKKKSSRRLRLHDSSIWMPLSDASWDGESVGEHLE